MNYTHLIIYGVYGLAFLTILSTIGAILSRKLRFKYSYLSYLQPLLYIFLGYLICKEYNLGKALLVNALLGLYDGTVGNRLSDWCKPYQSEEEKLW